MSNRLAELLREPQEAVDSIIQHLESLSGYESQDIRLLNQADLAVRAKTNQLGLDGNDSTAHEIYHSLLAKLANDSDSLSKSLDLNSRSIADSAEGIVQLATTAIGNKEVWSLKQSRAKALLKSHPPKALMKALGYRSIDSMLKHENTAALYAALHLHMSHSWLDSFRHDHSKLKTLDFENRKLEIISPSNAKWQTMAQSPSGVTGVPQLGSVVVWPTSLLQHGNQLAVLVLTLKACESVSLSSLIARAQQVQSDFGDRLVSVWKNDLPHIAQVANQPLQWRTLLNFFASLPEHLHPEVLEPHILASNLHSISVEDSLAQIHPLLSWWKGNQFLLGGSERERVSFNIADVALSQLKGSAYKTRSVANARMALWDELISRYFQYPGVLQKIEAELEDNLLPKSKVRVTAPAYETGNYQPNLAMAS
jgi:hypothetical protein